MAASPKTFVSYASEDRVFVLSLVMELRVAGADLWVDTLDILAGAPWDDQVDAALKACPQMLLVLSPASMKSQNVRDDSLCAQAQAADRAGALHVQGPKHRCTGQGGGTSFQAIEAKTIGPRRRSAVGRCKGPALG